MAQSIALARPQSISTPSFGGFMRTARNAVAISNQRRQLAALDDSRLADLGLTREEAAYEASRPFWDAPLHWLR